jgi:hypothetical protein
MMRAVVLLLAFLISATAVAQEQRPGIAVDSRGGGVIDPTKNVLDLVEAAIRRQDDLRSASEKTLQAKLEAVEKIVELRDEHAKEFAESLAKKLDEEAKLRADFTEKLANAESKRIDAIRSVDVAAVAVASQRAADQATVLATQVAQSAEALRNLVANTAATVATSQQQLASSLSARLTTLEQAGYQAQGKQTISDPAFLALVQEVKALSAANVDRSGVGAGRSDVIGWLAAAFMGMVAFAMMLITFFRSQKPAAK